MRFGGWGGVMVAAIPYEELGEKVRFNEDASRGTVKTFVLTNILICVHGISG